MVGVPCPPPVRRGWAGAASANRSIWLLATRARRSGCCPWKAAVGRRRGMLRPAPGSSFMPLRFVLGKPVADEGASSRRITAAAELRGRAEEYAQLDTFVGAIRHV